MLIAPRNGLNNSDIYNNIFLANIISINYDLLREKRGRIDDQSEMWHWAAVGFNVYGWHKRNWTLLDVIKNVINGIRWETASDKKLAEQLKGCSASGNRISSNAKLTSNKANSPHVRRRLDGDLESYKVCASRLGFRLLTLWFRCDRLEN